jgi:hypothetical protein
MMLVFMTVPHHHHDEMMCWVISYCDVDHAINDEHTDHDAADSHSQNEPHTGEINEINMPPENEMPFPQLTIICTAVYCDCVLAVNKDATDTSCISDGRRREQDGFMSSRSLRAPPSRPAS